MPYFSIESNIDLIRTSPQAVSMLSRSISQLLAKPEEYVMISLRYNPDMLFAGSADPLAFCQLKSLGLLPAQTSTLSQQICTLLQQEFNIPAARSYIEFVSPERALWGWNNKTF